MRLLPDPALRPTAPRRATAEREPRLRRHPVRVLRGPRNPVVRAPSVRRGAPSPDGGVPGAARSHLVIVTLLVRGARRACTECEAAETTRPTVLSRITRSTDVGSS